MSKRLRDLIMFQDIIEVFRAVKGKRDWEKDFRIGKLSIEIYYYENAWFGISFDWFLDKDND